ncbi:MAG: restriction endonuclease subunit S [Cyclobacteriaceae bacterium]|nr:restriction endonuclease subunit S [Cyclobacteriaceae bacterium]
MKFEKLKNIVEVKKGKKPSFVDTPDENSVRVLQIDDLRNDTNPKFTNDKTGVFAKEDDVLIAWDGANAGTIGYGKSGYIGSTIALLRKKQPDLYSTTFIGIFLQSQYQYLRSKTTGATIPHISRKALDELEVPVISVNDQLHIANLLSKAENLIVQRKESISLLDEFLKSTFLEMFGNTRHYSKSDVVKTIGEICNTRGGGTPSKAKPEYYTGEIPWVSPKDMKWLYITTSQDKITPQAIDESSTALIPKGSLLMVIRSGILKSKLPLAINKVDVTINQDMKAFTSKEVTTEYLLYFFFSEERSILKKVKGTTADNLNFDDVKKMKIKIPPLELQTQFAQIVEKTEALKTQYQQSLQELENLYGSLSQKAFRGELTKY